jgi:hypothetical protein
MRSNTKRMLAGFGMLTALSAPATVALAARDAGADGTDPAVAVTAEAQAKAAAHKRLRTHHALIRRDVHLARKVAHLRGRHVRRGYRAAIATWSNHRLTRHTHTLRKRIRHLRRTGGAPAFAASLRSTLAAIANCESHGNPRAIGGGGAYRGKYQMTYSSWASVGGNGDPAAASEVEQDRRAALLLKRSGRGQWPVCGR